MSEIKTLKAELPEISLQEVIHRLRIWLLSANVPDAHRVAVEIRFPSAHAQHVAMAALRQEDARHLIIQRDRLPTDVFEMEGIKVVLTNPERWDRR